MVTAADIDYEDCYVYYDNDDDYDDDEIDGSGNHDADMKNH